MSYKKSVVPAAKLSCVSVGVTQLEYERSEELIDIVVSRIGSLLNVSYSLVANFKDKIINKITTNEKTNTSKIKYDFLNNCHKHLHISNDTFLQMHQLVLFLQNHLQVSYLFEQSGNTRRASLLLNMLKSGAVINLEKSLFHPHDVTSALKILLVKFEEPLLLPSLFCNTLTNSEVNQAKCIEMLQLLLCLHPHHHTLILKDLFQLLCLTSKCHDENFMTVEKLSEIFTPLLFGHKHEQEFEVYLRLKVAAMIRNADKVFQIPFCVQQLISEQIGENKTAKMQLLVQQKKLKPIKKFQRHHKHEIKRCGSSFNCKRIAKLSRKVDKSYNRSSKLKQLYTGIGMIKKKSEDEPIEIESSYWRLPQPGDEDDDDWLHVKDKENFKNSSKVLSNEQNNDGYNMKCGVNSKKVGFLSSNLVCRSNQNQETTKKDKMNATTEKIIFNKNQHVIKISMV